MPKVILGGGLSGLSAAYYALKKLPNQPITLVESSNRLGGWIKSNSLENGIIFEQGPRTIRPHGEQGLNTLSLIEDLGLGNDVVPISSLQPAAKNRMIYVKGQLHSLPSSLLSIFKTQSPFSKPLIRFLSQDIFAQKKQVDDESIYDFVKRRFGIEVADYLISSMICGICAGNAKEISVNFLMKKLFDYEQMYGSISAGLVRNAFGKKNVSNQELTGLSLRSRTEKWSIYSLNNGLETLPKSLEKFIKKKNVKVEFKISCQSIETNDRGFCLNFDNGKQMKASQIISALPSETLSKLVQKQHPKLAEILNKIKSVSVGVVNLHYDGRKIQKDGFGFLVPPIEKLPILGVIYDTCCFPKGDNTVFTVMMGGHWFEQLFGQNPEEDVLLKIAKEQLKNILGISEEPKRFKVNILKSCIPQYTVGHNKNLELINEYIKDNNLPLHLCGASYNGVGVNDVILSAKNAVEKL